MDDKSNSTEEKIKNAARQVFHKKGFASTRTRDIAEAAGINLALLNYYFRSKEKLFQLIMTETLQGFASSLAVVFNNTESSLIEKVEELVNRYIDMLLIEPHIPLFIMSELRNNPQSLLNKLPVKNFLLNSAFARQYKESIEKKIIQPISMLHFIANIMGLTVFPFIASPILKNIGNINDENFNALMNERRRMIPVWIKSIMQIH